MIYTLHREQIIPTSIERVWTYFATPSNLNEMTPPDLNFEFLNAVDAAMYPGQIFLYKVTILPMVRVRWFSQITHAEPGHRFVDEQRTGPYRLWIHEHRFETIPGGVRMTDQVTYGLPFGFIGRLTHAVYIRRRLEHIFDFRRDKVNALFPGPSKNEVTDRR